MAATQNEVLVKKGFSLKGAVTNKLKGAKKGFERLSKNIATQMMVFENGIDQATKTVKMTQAEEDVLRDEYISLLKLIRQDLANHITTIEHEDERDFTVERKLLILQAKETEEKAHREPKKLCLAMRTIYAFHRPLPPEDTSWLRQIAPRRSSWATRE